MTLIEILIAMTILTAVLTGLGLVTARIGVHSRRADATAARTFFLTQQSNRFSVLPYDSIAAYAPRHDTLVSGRFTFVRNVRYEQDTTGSVYKKVVVSLTSISDTSQHDSLIFVRAKTYAHSPLFTK
jgi:Tfp pilus assembly protein PilV